MQIFLYVGHVTPCLESNRRCMLYTVELTSDMSGYQLVLRSTKLSSSVRIGETCVDANATNCEWSKSSVET